MAPLSSRAAMAAALTALLAFSTLPTQARAQIEDPLNVPLSPLELRFELNEAGGSNIAPSIESLVINDEPTKKENLTRRAEYGSGLPYWESQIKRQGSVAYGRNSTYQIWRNVKDYGATGDGVTDDTVALNAAIADGNRCGWFTGGYVGGSVNRDGYYGCDSQTTTPAIIYFPPGTYIVSSPVIMYYYSQMVGDANDLPVIKASPEFSGIGLFDSDPYVIFQIQWYQNQNNFFRHVRNFVFDLTGVPASMNINGMHWQVGQVASIQNCVFRMVQGVPGDENQQVGIFMDNGSSQFFEDLVFIGGNVGLYSGNQQLSIRNLTFYGSKTGIFTNWAWIAHYKGCTFNNCGIGLDVTQGGDIPSVHSVVMQDSDFNNCDYGILTSFSSNSTPVAAGTLVVDNCVFTNTDPAISYPNNTVIVPGGNVVVDSYVSGTHYRAYDAQQVVGGQECFRPTTNYSRIMGLQEAPPKDPSLLDSRGRFVERRRPQYEGVDVSNFISILDYGCPNDGVTDATFCVQNYFNSIRDGQIAFVDHGAYVITDTVTIPNNLKMIGEIWPLFMVTGPKFQDEYNPYVAFRVGQPGDVGTVEISQILFQTIGPTPGAIIMEWNLACTDKATCGMWDTHWRIGGTNGTQLQSTNCRKNQDVAHDANPACWCAFLLLHMTRTAQNVMMSHNWMWVSDHELDLDDKYQIDIYNGRNILIESQGPFWNYGMSSEHSQLYNTQVANAKNIYFSVLQSETAYMQSNPNSLSSFTPQARWYDPDFSECFAARCFKTISFRIYNSSYIYVYGAGQYSFFENYDSACVQTRNCDTKRIVIDRSEGIWIYAFASIAAQYLLELDGVLTAPFGQNPGTDIADVVGWFWWP